jgi:hypothetical protein
MCSLLLFKLAKLLSIQGFEPLKLKGRKRMRAKSVVSPSIINKRSGFLIFSHEIAKLLLGISSLS